MTINSMIENIPARELDYLVDTIMPQVLKKAADTNAFISEQADQCLIAACSILSD
jgi:hypothetical protein